MTVFTCEDNFDAMMTCVYEAWASRLGHSNIKIENRTDWESGIIL